MANNITLNIGLDASDAKSEMQRFKEVAQNAIRSSDVKIQKMGLSLQNSVNKMEKLNGQMAELASKRVPTAEYTALQSKIKEVSASLKQAKDNLSTLEATSLHTEQYDYITQKIQDINKELQDARQNLGKSIATSGYSAETEAWTNKVADLEAKLIEAQQYQQALTDAGQKYANANEFTSKIEKVKELEQELERLRTQEETMKTAGTDTMSGADTSKYHDLENQMSLAQQQSVYMTKSLEQAYDTTSKTGNKLSQWEKSIQRIKEACTPLISKLKSIGRQSTETGKTHNTSFKKMLTTVLKYGFGIRSIFLLYKKLRTVISTGLSEMSKQFSDVADDVYTLKNSWSGFKASLVSAFQPIFSYVVPALTTLINYLTSAMNAIANFFALLTGQSYYYKAVKGNESVAESIGSTGSAAEEANEELAEYDDLIVIDQDSNSGGSGGGGGSSASDAWNWEKTNVEANSLAEKLSNMWDVFKQAWENKGQAVITAATTALNNVKSLISTIAQTIYDVFVSGTGQTWVESVLTLFTSILTTIGLIASAWEEAWKQDDNGYKLVESVFNMFTAINGTIATITDSWNKAWTSDNTGVKIIANILQTLTSVNNTITNIANNFKSAWEKAGVGDRIMDTILGMVEDISGWIKQIATDTEEWSSNINFYPLLESISNILNSCRGVLDLILKATESLYRNYILPIVKKLTEESIPALLNEISADVDKIVDSLGDFDWDHFFTTLRKLTELEIDTVVDLLKEKLSGLANVASFAAKEITLVQKAIKTIESIGESNTMLSKLWDWLKKILSIIQSWSFSWENLFPGAGKVISSIDKITEAWESLKDLFDGGDYSGWGSDIFDGLVEGFTSGSWTEAASSVFKGFIEAIKSIFGINSPAENVKYLGEYILLGIIQGFKDKFTDIGTTVSNLYTTFKSKLSEKFKNFSITDILSNVGNIAITLTTTLAGGLTKLTDFTGLSTFFKNVKTKWNNLKSTLKTTLSGAFSSITGSNSLTSLSSLWSGLKEKWVDKSATLKTFLGGQMSYVTDITSWTNAFSTLRSTWADKTATMKAYVGGAVSSIEDIVSDSATSWKTKFTTFVNTIWQDHTATMKATANIGGQADNTLSNFKSGGGWYNTVTNFTSKIWKNTSALFSTTAKVGDTTNNSLSEMTSSGSSNGWYKRFTSFVNTWKQGATALFTSKFTNSDTNSQGYKNLSALRSAWSQTATAQFTSTYTNSDMNSAGYQNFNALWQNWYGRNADFTLSFSGNTADIKSLANNVLDKAYDALDRSGIKVRNKVWMARGGIVAGLTNLTDIMVGEAGAEAIVPLERNLGWLDKIATMLSDKLMATDLPDIVTGKTLPSTQEFISTFSASTKNIEYMLGEILNRLSALEMGHTDTQPIQVLVDGRVMAEVVWDETEKRYKQTGVRYTF